MHGGEEDRVVGHLGAQRADDRIVVPFLDKQHAGLGAGVRLEHIAMQTDHGENAAMLSQVFAQRLVGGVVETPLRQHHGHSPTGFEELKVALDKQNVPPDVGLVLDLDLAVTTVAHLVDGFMAGVQGFGEAGVAPCGIDDVLVVRIDLAEFVEAD